MFREGVWQLDVVKVSLVYFTELDLMKQENTIRMTDKTLLVDVDDLEYNNTKDWENIMGIKHLLAFRRHWKIRKGHASRSLRRGVLRHQVHYFGFLFCLSSILCFMLLLFFFVIFLGIQKQKSIKSFNVMVVLGLRDDTYFIW